MNETQFPARNNKVYSIHIDDDGERITVSESDHSLGSISLQWIESPDDRVPGRHYRITHLDLSAPTGLGIGRRCLQFHLERFASPLVAGEADGLRQTDGSHLTGRGAGFIEVMRDEGIVARSIYDDPGD